MDTTVTKRSFFTKDKSFYKTMFGMLIIVALQNLVAYSVNMADNIMLGRSSQDALSGASTVNQIFFIIQQVAISIGNTLVAIAAQYWGEGKIHPIKRLTAIALKLAFLIGAGIVILCAVIPNWLIYLFTRNQAIIDQGVAYLSIVKYSFILFLLTNVFMAALRAVGTVNISFWVSVVSLVVNVGINYVLIFGKFGAPEMGVRGAAIGTLVARILELAIVLFYVWKVDKKLQLIGKNVFKKFFEGDSTLRRDYTKTYIPIMCGLVLWGFSVPIQTAILGHLSDDAIAANSVATTFYQYLKVVVVAMSSTSGVMIGNAIGRGDRERVKSDARTLSVIDVVIGLVLGVALMLLSTPLLSFYKLSESATTMAINLIIIMGFIMMGMSYQMPVSMGIIQGGGDTKFTMRMNLVSTWVIVMPLSFAAAFWWKWPVEWVVIVVQSDQVFKCVPTFIHFCKYKWIKKLTR